MRRSTWAYITDERNLMKGCMKSYSRKSAQQRQKREVRRVIDSMSETVTRVHGEIVDGTYSVGAYHHYTLHDRKKDRNISVLPFVDRCVQNMLKDAIEPILVNQMTDEQTAGLPHRGIASREPRYDTIHQMRRAVTDMHNQWCILLDIHHCYDSINNVVVARLLERCIHDRRTLALLKKHLFAQPRLAIGDPISHLYCNLVVAQIVRHLKERCHCRSLVNFADNIAVFGQSLDEVKLLKREARQAAARLRLRINAAYPFQLDKAECVVWCGRKYYRNGKVLLRQDTKKRYIAARHRRRSLPSYQGILQSCNCKHLKYIVETLNNKRMMKQRTPFAGRAVKIDSLVGVRHTIVKTERKASKQKDSDFYYDVQAVTESRELIRYTTSSKLLVQALSTEEVPIRDVIIRKDWRGYFYDGSIYTNEEEAEIICREFGINY